MKINKKALLTAVKICSTVKNDSTPLWDSMLFQCQYGEITITGRSSRNILSHRLKAEDESSIQPFLFKGSTMLKLLKECTDDEITMTRNEVRMTISFGVSSFDLSVDTLKGMDYINTLPLYGEQKASMAIPVYFITEHKKAWENFCSTDELREVMQFISVEAGLGEINLVATNAHLLFNLKSEWYGQESNTMLLPSKMIGKLCKFMPKEDIHIIRYEKWAAVMFGTTSLLFYHPDGKYPLWQKVIPEDSPNTILLDAKEFKSAIRQVHSVSNSITHQIILDAGEKIQIHTHDFDFDQAGRVQIKMAVKEGADIKIGFNSVLLQQALDALKGTDITMTYTLPSRAVIFRGNGNKDTLALLMPVMVDDRG